MKTESKKTIVNRRGDLISFFRWCEKRRIIAVGSFAYSRIDRPKPGPGSRETCTPEELVRMLTHAAHLQDQVCIAAQALAGLRHAEVCRFRLAYVDWDHLLLRLPGYDKRERITKNAEGRDIPIPPPLFKLLSQLKAQKYPPEALVMRVRHWGNCLLKIRVAAGVHLPINALRHGYGSHRRQITQSVDLTASNMGTSVAYVKNNYSLPQLNHVSEAWFDAAPLPL